jgi:CubicO group peptidase (beta-lactamase class C family)
VLLARKVRLVYLEIMPRLPGAILFLLLAQNVLAQPAIDPAALDQLFADAEEQHSNALFVFQNGQPVRGKFFKATDRRIYLYSVTKVFTGLAVGLAWDQGLIRSIEEPVSTWYPEILHDPSKNRLKLRHLLQHTSGIFTTQGSHDIYPQKDFVKFALESPLVSTPGEEFKYNNRAINIASGIVRKATGKSMEDLLVSALFHPLEITDYKFRHDRAGNTWAMDGLELKVSDLVKIGCVLADGGRWHGKQIISEKWLSIASQASLVSLDRNGAYGLALFVLEPDARLMIPTDTITALKTAGLGSDIAAKLLLLAGKQYIGGKELGTALKQSLNLVELEEISTVAGRKMIPIYENLSGRKLLAHSGEIGEYLLAMPGTGISVARTIDEKRGRAGDYSYGKIYRRVLNLTPADPVKIPSQLNEPKN